MNSIRKSSVLFITASCVVALSSSIGFAKDVDLADGYNQLTMGNTEKAVDIFTRKVSKNPSSAACHTALGKALKRLGRIDEAKAEFRKACELDANFPDGFYEYGVAQESDRNWLEAATSFEKYLRLKPDASDRLALTDRIQYCLSQAPSVPVRSDIQASVRQAVEQANANRVATNNTLSVLTKPAVDVTSTTASTNKEITGTTVATVSPATTQSGAATAAVKKAVAADINKPIRDKWALIVGIGSFGNQGIPHLKYATKDARDLYDYLIHDAHFAPDHVRMLLDEKATQRRIMSELGSKFLARLAKPDDLIVLFFSTHGSPSQMDIRGKNYIIAYDSDPEDLFATGIEMQKILESIQSRVLSDRVLLVLDACHSGGADPNAKGMMRVGNFDAEALAEGCGQMVICSSRPDQQSWESKRYQNGVFTRNLLESLRKGGAKSPIAKAFTSTEQLVQDEVREDHPGARQTPMLQSKWSGNELIISTPAASPSKIPPTVAAELDADSSPAGQP